jgi:hypothetical protein
LPEGIEIEVLLNVAAFVGNKHFFLEGHSVSPDVLRDHDGGFADHLELLLEVELDHGEVLIELGDDILGRLVE